MTIHPHLGQTAMCPSIEQLQGVIDCQDPCQAAGCGVSGNPPLIVPPCMPLGTQGPLQPGQQMCAPLINGSPVPVASSCPAGETCTFFAGIPNTWVYGLGAALGVLMMATVLGGKR